MPRSNVRGIRKSKPPGVDVRMRSSLKPLAGKRANFRARFSGISAKGHVILEDVRSPGGRKAYIWIPFESWKGRLRLPGPEVHFSAEIGAYCRDHDNSFDFCLKDLQIEPEVRT
jgi:hypothetical protein